MEKIDQFVTGHPLGNLGTGSGDLWAMECSECGAVGVALGADTDQVAFTHLTEVHGAEAVTQ